jgi:zinc-ribbon domain
MRFACQSCGKAYNLPEERIADKSNVKLKCRVCGAIVEVKRQGELVASVLDEMEGKPMARVSEAPAPLTSITPEDDDPDGATVSISEASINDRGPLELELPSPAATGFAALGSAVMSGAAALPPPLTRSEASGEQLETNAPAPLPPPPLSPSSLPPPPALRPLDLHGEAASHGNGSNGNGAAASNGSGAFFSDLASRDPAGAELDEGLTPELRAPVAPSPAAGSALGSSASAGNAISSELADFPESPGVAAGKDPTLKLKMLAAFATGVLIDRIVSGLFQ